MKSEIKKFKHPRFLVMMGLVYNYGLGYGNDVGYYEYMSEFDKIIIFFRK